MKRNGVFGALSGLCAIKDPGNASASGFDLRLHRCCLGAVRLANNDAQNFLVD